MAYDPKATVPPQKRTTQPGSGFPAGTLVLLDLDAPDLSAVVDGSLHELASGDLSDEYADATRHAMHAAADRGPGRVADGIAVLHCRVPIDGPVVSVLARLKEPLELDDGEGHHTQFVWLLSSHHKTHPHVAHASEFTHLLRDEDFRNRAISAVEPALLGELYAKGLNEQLHFEAHIPPELRRTGRLFGGIIDDIQRKAPHYVSDFTDGLTTKGIASVFFMFFACLAPAVAFGGLLSAMTNNSIGAVEMIVATALCGVTYALFSGQPLTILGSTGPVIIFMGILYRLCESYGAPYFPTLAWVGIWTSVFLLILAAVDACSWIRYFTRFTDDTFAALISLIFIYEAIKDLVHVFTDEHATHDIALLSLILALGTYLVATQLSLFRRSPYLRSWVREFLADFGPAIAITAMTLVAVALHEVQIETIAVPDTFAPTADRAWLVNPMEAPTWIIGASTIPAVLVSILLYLDQNITVRLVNSPDNKLKKGAGYNLDLALVAVLVLVCSLFGLPWMVAATVRSLNHVRSLATIDVDEDGQDHVTEVLENRSTALFVHIAVGCSLLLLPLLQAVPMSVLFGLFLYMGVASMGGNQFFERARLWLMDPEHYPPTHYLRAVPLRTVHAFTVIQAVCLAILWTVKTSSVGILFPLFIALLVPVRMLLERFFDATHLALLDSEEEPSEEEMQMLD